MTVNPQARQDDIVVQDLFDEMVIYDLKRDKIHALNPTAAFVWQHCDGGHTTEELIELLKQEFKTPQTDALLVLTLERLNKAHLLAKYLPSANGRRVITRREALKMAGLTIALLPVVKSIVAPTAVQAAGSCTQNGLGCGASSECCSLNCHFVSGLCAP